MKTSVSAEKLFFPYVEANNELLDNSRGVADIYKNIIDDVSKGIYEDRILYSMTNDFRFIRRLVERIDTGKQLRDKLSEIENQKVYIYGAGIRGERLWHTYPELNWQGYIDERKQGSLNGLRIMTVKELPVGSNIWVFISNMYDADEIKQRLQLHGIENGKIIVLTDYDVRAREHQYFEERCIGNIRGMTAFADCGSYDGSDTLKFLRLCGKENGTAYAFESDPDNYNVCANNIGNIHGVTVFQQAVSDRKGSTVLLGEGESSHMVLSVTPPPPHTQPHTSPSYQPHTAPIYIPVKARRPWPSRLLMWPLKGSGSILLKWILKAENTRH